MSPEVRARTVLEVLSGRHTVAEAAADLGVTRQTIYNWRAAFVAGGTAFLGEGRADRESSSSAERTTARVEAVVVAIVAQLRRLAGTDELDIGLLEAIRTGAGVPVNRFCELTGIPRRTYYARRATPAAAPAVARIDGSLAEVRANHPTWGARRIWRHLTEVDGVDVSLATVKRARTRQILREARHMSN